MGLRPLIMRGLTFGYPTGRPGVSDVDLELAQGDILTVLGPNGAGKSTLLRLASGELRPSIGTVRVFAAETRRRPPSLRRRIGVASDTSAHVEPLTGLENAVFFGRAAGLDGSSASTEATHLLSAFGMAGDLQVPVAEYSLGMKRKLLLAQALLHSPDLLILDEPTVGLDPPSLDFLSGELVTRCRGGAAVLIATNDVRTATSLATRVVFLRSGLKVADAPLEELLESVRGVTRIEVHADAIPDPLPSVDGVSLTAHPRMVVAESRVGSSALPEICRALTERGVLIRSLFVRDPDLGDVFRRLTGADLGLRQEGVAP